MLTQFPILIAALLATLSLVGESLAASRRFHPSTIKVAAAEKASAYQIGCRHENRGTS